MKKNDFYKNNGATQAQKNLNFEHKQKLKLELLDTFLRQPEKCGPDRPVFTENIGKR